MPFAVLCRFRTCYSERCNLTAAFGAALFVLGVYHLVHFVQYSPVFVSVILKNGRFPQSSVLSVLLQTCGAHRTPPRGSTIGEGGDTTISSPGRSSKQPLPGMRLRDPLHDRQACPKFIAFDQGIGQICPR